MRTRYKEHAYVCGNYLDLQIYSEYAEFKGKRKRRYKPTSEVQKKLNKKNRVRKLVRLLNTNFTTEDLRFDVTYNEDYNPSSAQEAKKQMNNFIRRLKNYRKRNNLPELKYVYVTERGSRNKRFHHHIVMNGGISINKLAEIWGKGYTQAKPLQFDDTGIESLANYLLKNPITVNEDGSGNSYCLSRNLQKPTEHTHSGRISRRKIEFMFTYTDTSELEKLYPGYKLVALSPYFNDVNCGYYFSCKFIKLQQRKRGKNYVKRILQS